MSGLVHSFVTGRITRNARTAMPLVTMAQAPTARHTLPTGEHTSRQGEAVPLTRGEGTYCRVMGWMVRPLRPPPCSILRLRCSSPALQLASTRLSGHSSWLLCPVRHRVTTPGRSLVAITRLRDSVPGARLVDLVTAVSPSRWDVLVLAAAPAAPKKVRSITPLVLILIPRQVS